MARQLRISEREFEACWKRLPEADRRFIGGLIVVNHVVADGRLHYHELSPQRARSLRRADRDTVFSILTECLGILTNAPAMQRVRKARRQRAAQVNGKTPASRREIRSKQARRG